MSEYDLDEKKALSTVANTVVASNFPSNDLAPWMSKLNKKIISYFSIMESKEIKNNIVDQGIKLSNQYEKDLEQFNKEGFYEKISYNEEGKKIVTKIKDPPIEPKVMSPYELINEYNRAKMLSLRNHMVSEDGAGRKDGPKILGSMTGGKHTETEMTRSRMDKLLGRNKHIEQE